MLQEDHLQMSAKGGVAVARERNRITSLGTNRRTVHIPVYIIITRDAAHSPSCVLKGFCPGLSHMQTKREINRNCIVQPAFHK